MTDSIQERALLLLSCPEVTRQAQAVFILTHIAGRKGSLSATPAQRRFWYQMKHLFFLRNNDRMNPIQAMERDIWRGDIVSMGLLDGGIRQIERVAPLRLTRLMNIEYPSDQEWQELLGMLDHIGPALLDWAEVSRLAEFAYIMCQESSSQNQRLRILIEQRGNPLIRSMAISALVANLGPVLADYLRDLLQDSEPMIRSGAIRALGMMKDERGLDPICLGLLDNSPSVRLSTLNALANIGTNKAIQILGDMLRHEDYSMRIDAAMALSRIHYDRVVLDLLIEAAQAERHSLVIRAIDRAIAEAVWPRAFTVPPTNEVLEFVLEIRGLCESLGLSGAVTEISGSIKSYTPRLRERSQRDKAISANQDTTREPRIVSSDKPTIRESKVDNLIVKSGEQIASSPGIVAAVDGIGFAQIFEAFGADHVVMVGEVIPPTVPELVAAITKLPKRGVIFLPNHRSILEQAEQARSQASSEARKVDIVPSLTMPQGISALLAFNPDASLEINVQAMKAALTYINTGEVRVATADSKMDSTSARTDHVVGFLNDRLTATGPTQEAVARELLRQMDASTSEVITIYWGQSVTATEADALVEMLQDEYPEQEVEGIPGGQSFCQYLIGVE